MSLLKVFTFFHSKFQTQEVDVTHVRGFFHLENVLIIPFHRHNLNRKLFCLKYEHLWHLQCDLKKLSKKVCRCISGVRDVVVLYINPQRSIDVTNVPKRYFLRTQHSILLLCIPSQIHDVPSSPPQAMSSTFIPKVYETLCLFNYYTQCMVYLYFVS